jgi:type II secretory ATPase GspE/PulE/Tfp pilus assembly ATPase PilB-like protein
MDDMEILKIAHGWGWKNPTAEVIEIARQAYKAKNTRSAQLLVDMGIVTEERKSKLLATKPANVQTITWFAQNDPVVAPYVEQILALKFGYPYYSNLSILSVHHCMTNDKIIARADELDAVVMLIEETTPVVVFSRFTSLIKFRSLGRSDRLNDPIIRALGDDLYLAIGPREEISTVLKTVRSNNDATILVEAANVWSSASSENMVSPVNREITRLIDHAITYGATDIALKPLRNGDLQVQIRKFGEMVSPKAVSDRISANMARQIVALLQAKSGANPTNTILRVPTDGHITYRSSSGDVFLRLSFIPMNHLGELRNLTSVSIRLLPRTESSVSLYDLRLDQHVIDQIRFAMQISQGMVLVVGPTNSGKSTTIAGAIGEHVRLFGDRQKRLSIEDPIERFLYGVQQYNAPQHIKDEAQRFEVILRAFKRHDPDMIWVGEVRDRVTADLCISAASTGHLVLSTLHANDTVIAFDVLAKMIEMEKRFQLVETISLLISQRLVKEVCPHCCRIEAPTDDERRIFRQYLKMIGESAELPEKVAHANHEGCNRCYLGYVGVLPINEVLPFDRTTKDVAIELLEGKGGRDALAKKRTLTMTESALKLLAQHKVELESILV